MQARFLAGSVSAIALMTSMTAANAADLDLLYGPTLDFEVGGDSTLSAVAQISTAGVSVNSAAVLAAIAAEQATFETNVGNGGLIVGSAAAVIDNEFRATAIGSENSTYAEADTITNGAGEGYGSLQVMVNDPDGSVNSQVLGTELDIVSSGTGSATPSSEAVSGNTVAATTTMNTAENTVENEFAANETVSSEIEGRSDILSATSIDSSATIAVTTSQLNSGGTASDPNIAGSAAQISDTLAAIVIDDSSATADAFGSFDVSRNSVASSFTGNQATTGVREAGSETEFAGSVSVVSQQVNDYVVDVPGSADVTVGTTPQTYAVVEDATASTLDTSILIDLGVASGVTNLTTLDGSAVVAANNVSSSSTGNSANTVLGFNAGVSLGGVEVASTGGSDGDNADIALNGFGAIVQVSDVADSTDSTDFSTVNQQVNVTFASRAVTSSTTMGVQYEQLDSDSGQAITVGSTDDLGGNRVTAYAAGNTAIGSDANNIPDRTLPGNVIDLVSGADFDASTALVSSQVVGRESDSPAGSADTIALVESSSIGVNAQNTDATLFQDSNVSINQNAVISQAEGNLVNNSVSIDAGTTLQAGDVGEEASLFALMNMSSVPNVNTPMTSNAGVVLSNFQGLVNSVTSATTSGTEIGIRGDYASYSGSAVNVDVNSVAATATGISARNSMALTAANIEASAGLNNLQVQGGQDGDGASAPAAGVPGGVVASVEDVKIGSNEDVAGGTVVDSSISVSTNAVQAQARGNVTTNDLEIAATTGALLLNENADDLTVDLATNYGAAGYQQFVPAADAEGAAVLLNTQITNQSTSASIVDVNVGGQLGGDSVLTSADGTSMAVDDNTVAADAIGNLVAANSPGNHLMIDGGASLSVDDDGDPAAVLANIQDRTARQTGDSTVSASVQDVSIDALVFGDLNAAGDDGSALSVTNNRISGSSRGNLTTENRITIEGTNIALGAASSAETSLTINALDATELAASTQDMSPMDIGIDAEAQAVLANVQRGSVAGISTEVGTNPGSDMNITGFAQGDVTESSIIVDTNTISALAYDNTATNTIALGNGIAGEDQDVASVSATSVIANQQIAAGSSTASVGEVDTVTTVINTTTPELRLTTTEGFDSVTTSAATLTDAEDAGTLTIDFSSITDSDEQQALIDLIEDNYTGVRNGTEYEISYSTGDDFDLSFLSLTGGISFNTLANPGGGSSTGVTSLSITETVENIVGPSILASVGGDITDAALSASNNNITADARANWATNAQSITANLVAGGANVGTITFAPGTAPLTDETTVTTDADYAIQNLQTRDPEASVEATAYAIVGVESDTSGAAPAITGSDLNVDGNAQSALAEGNVAVNSLSLEGTTVGTGTTDIDPVTMAVSSLQTGLEGGSATTGLNLFAPFAVDDSNVSVSGNSTSAETTLNSATNTASVSGTNVLDSDPQAAFVTFDETADPSFFDIGTLTLSGAVTLNNLQAGSGSDAEANATLSITNNDAVIVPDVADNGYGGLVDSSVAVANNRVDGVVIGNTATNTLSMDGTTSIDIAGVLMNSQLNEHVIDADATLNVAFDLNTVPDTNVGGIDNSAITVDNNVNVARGIANTSRNSASLTGNNINGPVLGGSTSGIAVLGDVTSTGTVPQQLDGNRSAVGSVVAANQQFSLEDVDATAETTLLTADDSNGVNLSALTQDNNLTYAQAMGNQSGRAANGIDTVATVTVDGANNVSGAATALSYQQGTGDLNAVATTNIGTFLTGSALNADNVGVLGSTVSMSGNQTIATAAQNDAATTVSVNGNDITGVEVNNFAGQGPGSIGFGGDVLSFAADGSATIGDNVLLAAQDAAGLVNSSATLNALDSAAGTGLVQLEGNISGSSLLMNNNLTEASAYANSALNQLTLAAETSLGATGALSNVQNSSADVTATALSSIGIVNAGTVPGTLSGSFPYGISPADMISSSVQVDENETTALARGNTSTNVLNASAGTSIATQTTFSSGTSWIGVSGTTQGTVPVTSGGGILAHADFAMLNSQANTGDVKASVNASFGGVLNSGEARNSGLRVSGNSLTADAIGNSAVNAINVAAGTPGSAASASIASAQYNAGDITATSFGGGATFGQTGGFGILAGNMTGSSASVAGNATSARAVGNSVVNRITRD